jgi:predicted NBD/HSP70 family sugar kinase
MSLGNTPRPDTLPAIAMRAADPSRGTNQAGVRLYNERLALSLIRRHGALPKADVARLTGLSAMTTTTIMNRLEAEGLLRRGEKQRGRVGQPSVPYALNPDGAFALGVKIGRRSSDVVIADLLGSVRARRRITYSWPRPAAVFGWLAGALPEVVAQAGASPARIAGMGVAVPFELWNWEVELGAPPPELQSWRDVDVGAELAALTDGPVHLCNDATAACGAELVVGHGARYRDFIYCFIGSFIGGGIVLNHALHTGRNGNAGALGSMPVARLDEHGRLVRPQLIRQASLFLLEERLVRSGRDPSAIWTDPAAWSGFEAETEAWIDDVAAAVAPALVAAAAVIDAQAMIVDGAMPAGVRSRLVARIVREADRLDRRGLSPADIVEGAVGPEARAIGAAMLPLLAAFAPDREILFKDEEVRA